MSMAKALRQQFPQAVWGPPAPLPDWDIVLMDNSGGNGPYIQTWNEKKLGPQPTPAQIAKWTAEYKPATPPTKQERLTRLLEREELTLGDLRKALNAP